MPEWLQTIDPGWLLAAGLTVLLVAWRAVLHLGRWRRRLRHDDRLARASQGEDAAERMLERRGYQICDTQVSRSWEIRREDQVVAIDLRADAIVEHEGRRLVAEVKTGRRAPDLGVAATRRQLLEYRVAYAVDGVVLVDVEAGRIDRVDFGLSSPTAPPEDGDRAICVAS